MSVAWIALTVLLLVLAPLSSWRALSLLQSYKTNAERMSHDMAERKRRQETRWRAATHLLSFLSLCLVPTILISEITQLTILAQRTIGAAVLSGLILTALKLLVRIEFKKPFAKDGIERHWVSPR